MYRNMGLIIQCKDQILHSTYTDYNNIKKSCINGCKHYVQNTAKPKFDKLYGIYLFLYKYQFSSKQSSVIIQSIFKINKFIHFSKNIYEILCVFLYSSCTNNPVFIK